MPPLIDSSLATPPLGGRLLALIGLLFLAACGMGAEDPSPELATIPEVTLPEPTPPQMTRFEGTIEPGEPLGPLLQRLGVPGGQASGAVSALSKAGLNMRLIRPGRPYSLLIDPEGNLLHFEYTQGPGERYHVDRSPTGGMLAQMEDAKVELRTMAIQGDIQGTLSGAVHRAGEGNRLIQLVVDVFQWDLNFYTDARKGDTFEILYTKEFVNGEPTGRYGDIIAATYTGSYVGERGVFRFEDEYFDAKGHYARRNFLSAPLDVLKVNSSYGQRFHPVHKKWKKHTGVDYGARRGTPIWAVSDGTVISAVHSSRGYGNHVRIRHANGYETLYGHMNTLTVVKGQRVKQKMQIGTVGSTGTATGPHLHFEVSVNGKRVNPAKQKMIPGKPIPKSKLPAYEERLVDLRHQLATLTNDAPPKEAAVKFSQWPVRPAFGGEEL